MYKDKEKAREYWREYKREKRGKEKMKEGMPASKFEYYQKPDKTWKRIREGDEVSDYQVGIGDEGKRYKYMLVDEEYRWVEMKTIKIKGFIDNWELWALLKPLLYSVEEQREYGQFMALCPFHNDNLPSMGINVAKGIYHCFGCGAKGNLYQLYVKLSGGEAGSEREITVPVYRRYRPEYIYLRCTDGLGTINLKNRDWEKESIVKAYRNTMAGKAE